MTQSIDPPTQENTEKKILIAGIGNILMKDDGFGVEVIKCLNEEEFPKQVQIIDFGIRELDLVYELMNGCDLLIIIDALGQKGLRSGSIFVIEPNEKDLLTESESEEGGYLQSAHEIGPVQILKLARSYNALPDKIVIVGCKPFVHDEGIGLSEQMRASIEPAAQIVRALVKQTL